MLVDEEDKSFSLNFWNWGALHEAVRVAGVLPDDIWGPMRQGWGPPLAAEHVQTLRSFLATQVLPRMQPGQRLLFTGEVTSEPDDGKMHYDDDNQWRNYSLLEQVLRDTITFLDHATGSIRVR